MKYVTNVKAYTNTHTHSHKDTLTHNHTHNTVRIIHKKEEVIKENSCLGL